MAEQHVIENAVFDISFGSEAEAFEQQSELGVLVQSRLMRVVDRVFDEMSIEERIFRIDQLEIDLGPVPYQGFQEELEVRLEARLRAALRDKLGSLRSQPGPREATLSREQSELEQLEYFLLSGRLPWHTNLGPDRTINQLLQRVLQSNRSGLVEFLRRSQGKQRAIRRLASQFPDELLSEFTETFSVGRGGFPASLVADLRKLWRKYHFLETTERDLRTAVWEQVITELLEAGQTLVEPEELVNCLMQSIASHPGAGGTGLLATLANEAAQPDLRSSLSPELTRFFQTVSTGAYGRQIAQNVSQEMPSAGVPEVSKQPEGDTSNQTGPADEGTPADIEVWQNRLADVLSQGDSAELRGIWPTLLRDRTGPLALLVIEVLQLYDRQARVRRIIASGLSEAMLRDLVELLEPAESRFIKDLMARPGWLIQALQLSAIPADTIKTRLWESTLSYLFLENNGRFNKRAYVSSLIQQTSIQNRVEYRDLIHSLATAVGNAPTTASDLRELPGILSVLSAEENTHSTTSEDTGTESRSLIQSYELYEQVQHRLHAQESEEDVESTALTQLLDQLTRSYPWQLRRLCRELLSGGHSNIRLFANLSASHLSLLVQALLSITQQTEPAESSDLLAAIDRYAAQAQDLKEYYRQVLECLVENRNIDFETIIATSHSTSSTAGTGQDGEQRLLRSSSAQEIAPDSNPEQSIDPLLRYLQGRTPISSQDATQLIQTLESLLARQPARLRQLLEPVLEVSTAAERIIDLMPERLLTRLIHLLRPKEYPSAQRAADIIAEATLGLGLTQSAAEIRQLKWHYIFRYLLEEGQPYQEGSFVRGLADYLAAETQQEDSQAFRERLGQRISRDALPATQQRHAAIVRAVTDQSGVEADQITRPERHPSSTPFGVVEPDITEDIYISNAGMVLAAPYLSRLFAMLDLTQASAFKDPKAAERAVHLLQFMVNESTNSPEYQLVLNKLLCGVRVGVPIEREIEITDREKEVIEGLIQGMIQNWKTIGNTSVSGFRESFLQREGRLQLQNDTWHLLVQPRAFDMLLDSLPWSFSTIKLPWMERVIYVEWR